MFLPTWTREAEKISQLKPMLAPSSISMSPFLQLRIVFRPMKTPLPISSPRLSRPFRVQATRVVDHDIVTDANLVRMTDRDVDAKDDVAADAAENPRIASSSAETVRARRAPSWRRSSRARRARARPKPGRPMNEIAILVGLGLAFVKQLPLDDRDPRIVLARGSRHLGQCIQRNPQGRSVVAARGHRLRIDVAHWRFSGSGPTQNSTAATPALSRTSRIT